MEQEIWSLTIDGSLAVGGVSVYFDEWIYGGEECPDGLSGALELRSPEGRWIRIDFEDCSLCGEATREITGQRLGEACLTDVGPLDQAVEDLRP